MKLRRVYYSGYQPVWDEVLAPPAPPAREHRLYQADWLLRDYPIPFDELLFDDTGNLPLGADPVAGASGAAFRRRSTRDVSRAAPGAGSRAGGC
jgi:predicted DNA-binding helix-hairpin-helix protein